MARTFAGKRRSRLRAAVALGAVALTVGLANSAAPSVAHSAAAPGTAGVAQSSQELVVPLSLWCRVTRLC
ncbi:hypothetical protein GCM10027079_03460 [Sediminivirga luteola]